MFVFNLNVKRFYLRFASVLNGPLKRSTELSRAPDFSILLFSSFPQISTVSFYFSEIFSTVSMEFFGSRGFSHLKLRHLLLAAGTVSAAAGLYVLYSRRRARHRPTTAGDLHVQAEPEDPVETLQSALHEAEPSVLSAVPEPDVGPLSSAQAEDIADQNWQVALCPVTTDFLRLFLERLVPTFLSSEIQKSNRTLHLSHERWLCGHLQSIYIRRHFVLQVRGTVSRSWWILTNDFYTFTDEGPCFYASVHRVTIAEHIDGRLAKVGSYSLTKHLRTSSENGVQVTEPFQTYQELYIFDDSWIVTYCSEPENAPPEPQPTCTSPPYEQSRPSAEAERDCAEACEVPALFTYMLSKSITNFPLRLDALRHAFSAIMSDQFCCNHVSVAGRMILGALASLNAKNLTVFQVAFDSLLAVAQCPSNREAIEAELAQIGIMHYNLMDVVFELVLFGVLGRMRPQNCPTPGGFLSYLMAMLHSLFSSTEQRYPRADQFQLTIQSTLLQLLDDVFALEERVYEDPGTLHSAVWEYIEYHTQQLLDRLEDF
ncbi:uncharacterized protein [Hoplias malabaricus]|uniref:uncharacterized protein n=1 Tax=Hoplias malabaricus TaxID=27720 RepID=UPI0034637E59